MQLILLASALLAAGVSANAYDMSSTCPDSSSGRVRIFNRCPYDVYLWSILKEPGCPSGEAVVIPQGGHYCEKMRPAEGDRGVSLKVSKTAQCSSKQLLQLEYYLETTKPGFNYNYLDVSYVDCPGDDCDCPTRNEGYYLKSGNDNPGTMSAGDNKICPILSCSGKQDCNKMSYVNWDDVQTKSCALDAPLDFYMCGGHAPDGDEEDTPSAAPSSEKPKETPTPKKEKPKPTPSKEPLVQAAAITPAPAKEEQKAPNVKTEVVYVTEVQYVNAKHRRHGHARRHEHFKA